MLIKNNKNIKKIYIFPAIFNLFFSVNLSILFIKGIFGIILIYMPSFYYVYNLGKNLKFLFISKFLYKCFVKHLFYYYNYVYYVYFIKLKIRGLGYRIRQLWDNLYYFFFNYTNFFYLYVPNNMLIKSYRKRFLLISSNWFLIKMVVSHILLLKKLGIYSLRGIRLVKQIILLKKSGKKI